MAGVERAEEAAQGKAVFAGMPAYYESQVTKPGLKQSKPPVIDRCAPEVPWVVVLGAGAGPGEISITQHDSNFDEDETRSTAHPVP